MNVWKPPNLWDVSQTDQIMSTTYQVPSTSNIYKMPLVNNRPNFEPLKV